jgi:tRNA (cmo5U34)-methyltransferase
MPQDTTHAQFPHGLDRLFAESRPRAEDFRFDADTAAVFDDMLDRSVPFYTEIQRMIGELSADYAVGGTRIYDFGCSTANTFLSVGHRLAPDLDLQFIGVDSSDEMLRRAEQKLAASRFPWPYALQHQDLNEGLSIDNASVALMVLTLQFVRPLNRESLMAGLCRGVNEGGCLLLVEKVLGEVPTFNRLFIGHYHELKRRKGYSELEIAQKREALENVLVPYSLEENKQLLRRAGFRHVDVFFKWYNFCGLVATK